MLQDWPFVGRTELLRDLAHAALKPAGNWVAVIGPRGVGRSRLLAELESVLRATTPTLRVSAVPGSRLDALALARSLADSAARQAVDRGTVIIDDVDCLESQALGQLADRLTARRCTVVAAARDGCSLPSVLGPPDGAPIEVTPLPEEELRGLLEVVLGGPVFEDTLWTLRETTAGNLWHLREIVDCTRASGALSPDALGCWRLIGDHEVPEYFTELGDSHANLCRKAADSLLTVACVEPVPAVAFEGCCGDLDPACLQLWDGGAVTIADRVLADGARRRCGPLRRRRALRELLAATDKPGADDQEPTRIRRRSQWRVELGGCDLGSLDTVSDLAESGDVSQAALMAACLADNAVDDEFRCRAQMAAARWLAASGDPVGAQLQLASARMLASSREVRTQIDSRHDAINFWSFGVAPTGANPPNARSARSENPLRETLAAVHALLTGGVTAGLRAARPLYAAGGPHRVGATLVLAFALSLAGRYRSARRLVDRLAPGQVDWDSVFLWDGGVDPLALAPALGAAYAGDAAWVDEVGRTIGQYGPDRHGRAWVDFLQGTRALSAGDDADALPRFLSGATRFDLVGQSVRYRWCVTGVLAASARIDRALASKSAGVLAGLPERPERLFAGEELRARGRLAMADGDRPTAVRLLREAGEHSRRLGASAIELGALADLAAVGGSPSDLQRLVDVSALCQGTLACLHGSLGRVLLTGSARDLEVLADRYREAGREYWATVALGHAASRFRRGGRRAKAYAAVEASASGGLVRPSHELTTRETDVSNLVADGLSNQEVAERLGLSRRTVDNVLHRIYTRLRMSGRRELANFIRSGRA